MQDNKGKENKGTSKMITNAEDTNFFEFLSNAQEKMDKHIPQRMCLGCNEMCPGDTLSEDDICPDCLFDVPSISEEGI